MRRIGKILLAIGIISIIGFVGTDDVEIMQGMNPSFESLFIKMIIGMSLVIIGIILMKRSKNHGC